MPQYRTVRWYATRDRARMACAQYLGLLATTPVGAQAMGPIYPSYEGYLTNEDGTHTLIFGYFNSNLV